MRSGGPADEVWEPRHGVNPESTTLGRSWLLWLGEDRDGAESGSPYLLNLARRRPQRLKGRRRPSPASAVAAPGFSPPGCARERSPAPQYLGHETQSAGYELLAWQAPLQIPERSTSSQNHSGTGSPLSSPQCESGSPSLLQFGSSRTAATELATAALFSQRFSRSGSVCARIRSRAVSGTTMPRASSTVSRA